MNVCVVSTFDCTVEDFRAMMAEYEKEMKEVASEWELAVINDHKTVLIANITDFDGMTELMSSEKMKAWDAANNCVDVVYSLEQVD
jgi:hypothetical protein